MANSLFFGDAHLGHRSITKYRTQFRDEQDHFEHIKENYHKVVTKRDVCHWTGDAVFSLDRLKEIATWPGKKVLVCGNHDTDFIPMSTLCQYFDEVVALKKYKEFWVSHAPMHPDELRGKVNIHGHVHYATVNDCRYFNTSCENIDFTPISLHQIRDIMEQRKKFYSIDNLSDAFRRQIPVGLR